MLSSSIIIKSSDEVGKRLDLVVFNKIRIEFPQLGITRSFVTKNISEIVTVNRIVKKKGYDVRLGDEICFDIHSLEQLLQRDHNSEIIPQEGPLNIIYEDEDILVINKDKGVVVHLGDGNKDHTLVNYLKYYFTNQGLDCNSLDRCGLVHRLDKGVSGLMIIAKNVMTQQYLKSQFEEHKVVKVYMAEVDGSISNALSKVIKSDNQEIVPVSEKQPKEELDDFISKKYKIDSSWYRVEGYILRDPLNRKRMKFNGNGIDSYNGHANVPSGKLAISYFKFLTENRILIKIETGRMHQIRATLKFLGLTIKGDTLYANSLGRSSDSILLESIFLGLFVKNNVFKSWKLI